MRPRSNRFFESVLAVTCAVLGAAPLPALAWGAQGHRIVNGAAMRTLPAALPAFLRTAAAHDEIALLGPEADRVKGGGRPEDADEDPAHYVDAQDDATVLGLPLASLPADEERYDAALRGAAAPSDMWAQGYLPYAIADGWQHIVRDLAYWRADAAGEANAATPAGRAGFAFDRSVREALTLRDIGYWGHFVGDGSQPLHVTVHFNGWNGRHTAYANPNGYSDSPTMHSRFETALVDAVATEDAVAARVPAPAAASDAPILARVGTYLATTASFVPAVYRLEAQDAIDARAPDARALVLDRLAAGAAEMHDLLADAWSASANVRLFLGD